MRKRIKLTHLIVAAACLALACPLTAAAEEEITLECIQWKSEATEAFEGWAEAFHELYPNITVEFSAASEYNQTLQGRIATGDIPDLIAVPGGNYGLQTVNPEYLLDLTGEPFLDNIREDMVKAQTYGGKIYSLPVDISGLGIIYNRDVFEENGIEVPQTFDELIEVCKTLQENGIVPMAYAGAETWAILAGTIPFNVFIYGGNPDFDLDVMEGRESYNNDLWKKALGDFTTIASDYGTEDPISVSYSYANEMVANGEAAMTVQGIWVCAAIEAINPDVRLGFFIPGNEDVPENRCISFGPDFTMGISATTEHKEECLKFLEFISSQEGSKIWTDKAKTFSAVKDSDMSFSLVADDIKAILDTGIKTYPLVNHMWYTESVGYDWASTFQQYLEGEISLDESLDAMDTLLKEAYESYIWR